MLSLEEIGVKHGTGKSSLTCDYLRFYDLLFRGWRNKPINLLEIGVQFGHSLRTWRDYFPEARITGIDITDNGVAKEGFSVIIGDAYNDAIKQRIHGFYHIIIDDGSHNPDDQRFVVMNYPHLLTRDGILIVEDVLSKDTIPVLIDAIPHNNFFNWCVVEREGPCRLFIVTRLWPPGSRSAVDHLRTESHYAPPL